MTGCDQCGGGKKGKHKQKKKGKGHWHKPKKSKKKKKKTPKRKSLTRLSSLGPSLRSINDSIQSSNVLRTLRNSRKKLRTKKKKPRKKSRTKKSRTKINKSKRGSKKRKVRAGNPLEDIEDWWNGPPQHAKYEDSWQYDCEGNEEFHKGIDTEKKFSICGWSRPKYEGSDLKTKHLADKYGLINPKDQFLKN